ncbi:hypothetical protein [Shewanella colwelliana]|uniref:hypothetical protein n=1 Tax=Shewanella colwelliana TaxID=23 RepID=UPI0037353214
MAVDPWFVIFKKINTVENIDVKGIVVEHSLYNELETFKMLNFDLEQGVASESVVDIAKKKLTFYFDEVSAKCSGNEITEDFLLCANDILGGYFSYYYSTELSNNIYKQISDCDTNSYLIYDVANLLGYSVSVMYTPGHSLITWVDSNGERKYLETTASNNHGSVADIRRDVYIKSKLGRYYHPFSGGDILDVYKSLILIKAKDKSYISKIYDDKPYLNVDAEYFYYIKNSSGLTYSIVNIMNELHEQQLATKYIKLTLAEWYYNKGNVEKAYSYVGDIKLNNCYSTCAEISSYIGYSRLTPKVWWFFSYSDLGDLYDINISLLDFYAAWLMLFLMVVFFMKKLLLNIYIR